MRATLACLLAATAAAFIAPTARPPRHPRRLAAGPDDDALARAAGGALRGPEQAYSDALEKLNPEERYNAVLSGLIRSERTKLFSTDAPRKTVAAAAELLEEMTKKNVKASGPSLSLLIDAASDGADAPLMGGALRAARSNGVASRWSSDMSRLSLLPASGPRRKAALSQCPQLGDDARESEVTAALATSAVLGGAFFASGIAPLTGGDALLPNLLILACAAAAGFDALQNDRAVLGIVGKGFNRLITRDREREAMCEAASFLVAYLIGLPCFAFSPNVIEASQLAAGGDAALFGGANGGKRANKDETPAEELARTLSTANGRHRLLVWLAAPAAAESAKHAQLIVSDPRQIYALLKLLRAERASQVAAFERASAAAAAAGSGGAKFGAKKTAAPALPSADDLDDGGEDDEARVRWALSQARLLLRKHAGLLELLQRRLMTGGATVGECVQAIESAGVSPIM